MDGLIKLHQKKLTLKLHTISKTQNPIADARPPSKSGIETRKGIDRGYFPGETQLKRGFNEKINLSHKI